ncbi:MAG: hypothetical protein K6F09_04925 [Clostridiales bacterium]|nr:hypothetical protein [Clostridiales bacterium]
MNKADKRILYAYKILDRAVPYSFDCGRLCKKRCCSGDDDTGMILFSGEEKLFENDKDFKIKTTGDGKKLLVCRGICDRKKRPLSCRIYPFFPMLSDRHGKPVVKVVYDLRGYSSCPAVRNKIKPDPRFVSAVRRAAKVLCGDEKNKEIIIETDETIKDIFTLQKNLLSRGQKDEKDI